jgi:hypothetical protein
MTRMKIETPLSHFGVPRNVSSCGGKIPTAPRMLQWVFSPIFGSLGLGGFSKQGPQPFCLIAGRAPPAAPQARAGLPGDPGEEAGVPQAAHTGLAGRLTCWNSEALERISVHDWLLLYYVAPKSSFGRALLDPLEGFRRASYGTAEDKA